MAGGGRGRAAAREEMAAGRLERARGLWGALAVAVGLQEEEGDVPARLLLEHLMDTRRKQKLLLTQLRVLRRLLGLLQNPGPLPAPPDLGAEGARARGRWRELKAGYGGALEALGGALSPLLPALRRGKGLGERLGAALGARKRKAQELRQKLREARGRRQRLEAGLGAARKERNRRGGALRERRGGASRAQAGGRLYQLLSGVRVLPPPPSPKLGAPKLGAELELGPPPGHPPDGLSPPRIRRLPRGGGFAVLAPAPPPPSLSLPELQQRLWGGRPLAAEIRELQQRFALDWDPAVGRVRVLGGPRGGPLPLWTLELDPGYPQNGGGVRLLPPPGVEPPEPPPTSCPTLTQWLELLVGAPPPETPATHK